MSRARLADRVGSQDVGHGGGQAAQRLIRSVDGKLQQIRG